MSRNSKTPAQQDAAKQPPESTPADPALFREQLAASHEYLKEVMARAAAGDADAIAHVEAMKSSMGVFGSEPAPAAADEPAAPYAPVGKVRVIAKGERGRILEDDVRRWKEPRE